MANTLLTPSIIARAAIATLYAQTRMASLVHRDFAADFDGQVGDTITVRKPATFTADEFDRGTGIVIQDATETSVSVMLDTLLDVSFAITSEEWALEIKDFQMQFLSPAMEAISQKVDQMLLGLNVDVTQTVPLSTADETAKNSSVQLIDAGKVLNDSKVPDSNRNAVLGTHKTSMYLRDPLFHSAEKRGDTVGLIEAAIGRKFGFDCYMSQNQTTTTGLCFHRNAFALVSRTLPIPRGVSAGQAAVESYKGLGIRVIYSYDVNKKQDVVSVDLLCGVKTLTASMAAILQAAA